ncbi:MAG: hypothetical protein JXA46_08520 [Dehalococcoidales bacterium]|nr:hypothetical protein [Dehalococcoidales bacterium]
MKISKVTWMCLIAGVFIIAGVSLGMARSQQTDQQQELQEKLANANARLSAIKIENLIEQQETLTSEINSYEAQTAETMELLSYSSDSIDTTAEILAEGQRQGVEINEISSPGVSSQVVEGNTCQTLALNLLVTGNVGNISAFIQGLSTTFPTSVIKSLQIEIIGPSPDSADLLGNTAGSKTSDMKCATARINMVIYNYKARIDVE